VLTDGGPVVVWIRLPNTRRRDLLIPFATILPHIEAAMERDDALIQVT
jgi:hypothetical protein